MLDHAYKAQTWIPYLLIFVEFVSAIAWPTVVGLVAYLYRRQVERLLERVSSLGVGQAKAEFKVAQQSNDKHRLDENIKMDVVDTTKSQEILEMESRFRSDLDEFSQENHVSVLISALTTERLYRIFAIAYSNIFGSQIRALRLLVEQNGRVTKLKARDEFLELQKEIPALSELSLEQYLKYLYNFEFIKDEGDEIHVTFLGKQFLKFMIDFNLSENRLN